ncbi:MAG: site-specific DNA-methyltransferase [bacterium]
MKKNPDFAGPKERRFLGALSDLFVGAKVDGQSGYINLMRIKAAYFEKIVEPALITDIAAALKDFPEFREELFDKLHSFFSRYFSRSGSICFAYTPQHMSVYEKVYTDEQDVVLFWKTHMLYYVKTDRLFRDLKVDLDGQTFFFDCTGLEHKKANEKRELIFTFDKVEKDGAIRLDVTYSERGRITKTEDILKALKKAEHPVREAVLDKALKVFGRQSEVDYFINKDARGFLREQFDLWMYQYVFKDETNWTAPRIRQLQALKTIAFKIVDFIAQFEDELVRIWNKPKFVRGSHYVITLDRVAAQEGGLDLLADVVKHAGMKDQVAEWLELGIVDKDFDPKAVLTGKGKDRKLVDPWRSLPIDTKYFKALELRLLGLFDNLDEALDGRLIKSENYQALNTLREKYRGRVKLFYIDPPYNTGEDEFAYMDSFQRSSWLSMILDRLQLGRDAMSLDGVMLSSIGREEFASLKQVADRTFGDDNCLAELVWEKGRKNDAKYFSVGHDYILVYAKSKAELDRRKTIWREEKPGAREILAEYRRLEAIHGRTFGKIQDGLREFYEGLPKGHISLKYRRYNRVDSNGVWRDDNISWPGGNGPEYDVIHHRTKKKCKVPDGGWRFATKGKFDLYDEHGFIEFRENETEPPMLKRYLNFVSTDFDPDANQQRIVSGDDDEEVSVQVMPSVFYRSQQPAVLNLRDVMGEDIFKNPKDPEVIARLIKYITAPGQIVGDFFLGSGTTGEAVISLIRNNGGRRFLFVEAADYVETIILPRFKKLAWSDQWDKGRARAANGASLFFKYCRLEQYEDAVAHAVYSEDEGDLFRNTKTDPYSQYVFFRDLKMAEALELDYEKDEVNVHLDRLYPDIDLAETLSCVTGKWIKRITADEVEFADGSKQSLAKPDWRLIKPLIFWGPVV